MLQAIKSAASVAYRNLLPKKFKERHELAFWRQRFAQENGTLWNAHYEQYYTKVFGIDRDFYSGKRMLDIGCGPRGSLEWADMARERIGLDSLAKEYRKLGAKRHKMRYVAAGAESIPFPTGYFDAAFAFNSLDHVQDVDRTIAEIKRVVKLNGLFLLITELNHDATPTEPQSFSFEIIERFMPEFRVLASRAFEITNSRVYTSIDAGLEYDLTNPSRRPALVCAKFLRE